MTTSRTDQPAVQDAATSSPALHRAALVAAAVATVVAPLLTLAYLRTTEGAEYATQPTVEVWAEPAGRLIEPALTFASADAVYTTWTVAFVLAFAVVPVAAVRAGRPLAAAGRGTRLTWRAVVAGYGLFTTGAVAAAATMAVAGPSSAAVNLAFLGAMLPGLLLSLLASTAFGIALLRTGRRGAGPWLLALAVPGWVLGSMVLGHNSLGLVPLVVAWALLTRPRAR